MAEEGAKMMEEFICAYEMGEKEKMLYQKRESLVFRLVPTLSAAEKDKMRILEGLLYVVGEDGIHLGQLSAVLELDEESVKRMLEKMRGELAKDEHGLELVSYGGLYKILSKPVIAPFIQKLFQTSKANNLSQSALETLAIIAYKGPITRFEIEELRGVGAEMMLRKLVMRGLIEEVGRSDAPGRPILYGVTEEFMDSFKLYSLNDLPKIEEVKTESEELFE